MTANILSKDQDYPSPFMTEWKKASDEGKPMGTKPPPGFNFLGGKEDDITVTVAQVFADNAKNEQMKDHAKKDKYFEGSKFIYKEKIELPTAQHEADLPTVDSVRQKLKGADQSNEDHESKKELPACEKAKPSHIVVDPRIRKPLATKQATVIQVFEEEKAPVVTSGLSQRGAHHHHFLY